MYCMYLCLTRAVLLQSLAVLDDCSWQDTFYHNFSQIILSTVRCCLSLCFCSFLCDIIAPIQCGLQSLELNMVELSIIIYQCHHHGSKYIVVRILADRQTKIRHALLLCLLSHEENHESLTSACNELINDRPANVAVYQGSDSGRSPYDMSIYAKKSVYYNSFLPKTVCETIAKLGSQ